MSTLYIVATPIGNLEDVSARARRVLSEVGAIAVEDTRITARLLARHEIRKPMISYRAPVERRGLPRVMAALDEGDVALVSDAGTPTLSDPGAQLVNAAWAAGHTVVPIPGPSAIAAALSVAGHGGPGFTFVAYRAVGECLSGIPEDWRIWNAKIALTCAVWPLVDLGRVAILQGDVERAIPLLEESLRVFRSLADSWGTAWAR